MARGTALVQMGKAVNPFWHGCGRSEKYATSPKQASKRYCCFGMAAALCHGCNDLCDWMSTHRCLVRTVEVGAVCSLGSGILSS
jgi:hypothetical protein